jgi:hypothetical protein
MKILKSPFERCDPFERQIEVNDLVQQSLTNLGRIIEMQGERIDLLVSRIDEIERNAATRKKDDSE